MIRCTKSKVNLKSSTYNQTGQRYFEQLEACNFMNWHLRRILLAKSAVDTKNKDYILKKSRQCKVQGIGHEMIYLHTDVIDDVIDRLAYDTQNHPMDVLRMDVNSKRPNCCNCCNLDFRQRSRRQLSSSKSRKTSPTMACSPKRKKFTSKTYTGKDFRCARDISPVIDASTYSQRGPSHSVIPEVSDHHSVLSSTSRSYDSSGCDNKFCEQFASKRSEGCQKNENKKYIKFVYNITRDIMQNGLYTDKELQSVFKRHVEQNKRTLNMNRMLYEIYQLKISFNIADDSEDDELDDLIHAQKLLTVSEIRPPTPPKVLDENKVMEKLESYQKMTNREERFLHGDKKSVTLVDANNELLVTEEDVLLSLMEGGIDPKQAQHICRSLLYRSRDAVAPETVQVDAATCSTDLKINDSEESRDHDEQTSQTEIIESTHDSVANDSNNSAVQQGTSSLTSDVISTQTETIETKEDMQSETQTKSTSENDGTES